MKTVCNAVERTTRIISLVVTLEHSFIWLLRVTTVGARSEYGVDAVKQLLSTLTSDERWGVLMAIDEAQPHLVEQLVAVAPDWMQWLG